MFIYVEEDFVVDGGHLLIIWELANKDYKKMSRFCCLLWHWTNADCTIQSLKFARRHSDVWEYYNDTRNCDTRNCASVQCAQGTLSCPFIFLEASPNAMTAAFHLIIICKFTQPMSFFQNITRNSLKRHTYTDLKSHLSIIYLRI